MSDVSTVVPTQALQAILRSATASPGDACSRRRRLTDDPPSALRQPRAALLVEGVPTP
jgi:hypothetical protein